MRAHAPALPREGGKAMTATTRPRPRSLPSTTTKLNTEFGNLYVTVSVDEAGEPFEVFGWLGKGGSFQHGVTELACRLISLHLRRGTPVEEIIDQCQGIQEMQPYYNRLPDGSSVAVLGLGRRHRPRPQEPVPDPIRGASEGRTGEGNGNGEIEGRMSDQDNATLNRAGMSLRGPPRFPFTGGSDMTTTTIDRAEVFSRPAARFDDDGQLEIRASAVGNCRRALWYAATGYEPANPPSQESLTAMEAGNALEPVVARAMERAGWQVDPAGPPGPATGGGEGRPEHDSDRTPGRARHGCRCPKACPLPDGGRDGCTGDSPDVPVRRRASGSHSRRRDGRRDQDSRPGGVQALADAGRGAQPPAVGGPGRLLHAGNLRRSSQRRNRHDGHWQPDRRLRGHTRRAVGTGLAGCLRMARTAGSAPRAQRAGPQRAARSGTSPQASWQCRYCPFLDICLPGAAEESERRQRSRRTFVSDEEAQDAVAAYTEAQAALKKPGEGQARRAGHPEGVDARAGRLQGEGRGPDGEPGQPRRGTP